MNINPPTIDQKHPLIGIYGPPGVGKSTLAAQASKPVFINIENAIHQIKVSKTDVIRSSNDLKQAIATCAKSEEFNTIVIDTIDAYEDILTQEILQDKGWSSLAEPGYGKGYAELKQRWLNVLPYIRASSQKYNKTVILVGHDTIKRYDDPTNEGYDRIILKLNQHIGNLLFQYSDMFLYMRLDETVLKNEDGRKKVLTDGSRVLYTEANPAFMAKNRYSLESRITVNDNDLGLSAMKSIYQKMGVIYE